MRFFDIDYKRNDNKIYDINKDDNLYKVELIDDVYANLDTKSLNKVLRLETYKDFKNFYEIYKYVNKDPNDRYKDWQQINWKKVYVDYGGIELTSMHFEKMFVGVDKKYENKIKYIKWWREWDVPSGCIWNKDLIKTLELIL